MRGGWESGSADLYNEKRGLRQEKRAHTVGLLSDDLFDVEGPSLSVDGLNLALTALEGSAHDLDGVTLADGDGTNVVLSAEVLAQVGAHDLSSDR